ncbi:MAG: alpha/beta fold hydrolase [Lachnospiraceae bacterium]|nr:alpha/beta fold hydrolase [Lachnospiraceae bacterium]
MKTKTIFKGVLLASTSIASISLLNRLITKESIAQNLLYNNETEYFNWRYGRIHYTKTGTGTPLLLIHELAADASAYEWEQLKYTLAQTHTVYSLDLLGCGRSEKPDFSYTNYTYVQLVTDFIRLVIGQPADIVTSGESSTIAIMAASSRPELFHRIVMITPESIYNGFRKPGKTSKLRKKLIDTPVIGTLIYNIAFSPREISSRLKKRCIQTASATDIAVRAEASHLGGGLAKQLYACIKGDYLHVPFRSALQKTDLCLYLILGSENPEAKEIAEDYQMENPAVEVEWISNAGHYPHIEQATDTAEMIQIFLS